MEINNYAELCGTLDGKPVFSHSLQKEEFYTFPLAVERLSGTVDTVNVIVRRELLNSVEIEEKGRIMVRGELRSYNNKSGQGNKLVISVLARQLYFTDEQDKNFIILRGTLCKTPNFRRTPMGRGICDMMLAVNRQYGRSDYLPCIAWGKNAQIGGRLNIGDCIGITGRLQSRRYIKNDEGTLIEKTAFEVSIVELEV